MQAIHVVKPVFQKSVAMRICCHGNRQGHQMNLELPSKCVAIIPLPEYIYFAYLHILCFFCISHFLYAGALFQISSKLIRKAKS